MTFSDTLKSLFLSFFGLSIAALLSTSSPQEAWAGGALAVSSNGSPMVFSNPSTLKFNPDNGPFQSTEAIHSFNFGGDLSSLDSNALNAFCAGGGGGGTGGCSLSPWIRDAQAAAQTNAEGIALVNAAFGIWNASGANLNVTQGAGITDSSGNPIDVTVCNIDQIAEMFTPIQNANDPRICGNLNPPTCSRPVQNPVIFDTNGDITAAKFGEASRVSTPAFAAPILWPLDNPTTIVGFFMVLNGTCAEDTARADICGSIRWNNTFLQGVATHEGGHGFGFDHTQVNGQAVTVTGVGEASLKVGYNLEAIPTMYPFAVTDGGGNNQDLNTLHVDDKATAWHLYPKTGVAPPPCKAVGKVFNNTHPPTFNVLRGVEVVLRPNSGDQFTGPPVTGALSGISGAEVQNDGAFPNSTCTAGAPPGTSLDCGKWVIDGLTPGTTYTLETRRISSFFALGSSYGPLVPPFQNFSPNAPNPAVTVACPPGGGAVVPTPATALDIQDDFCDASNPATCPP